MMNMTGMGFDWDQGNEAKIVQRFNLEEVEKTHVCMLHPKI